MTHIISKYVTTAAETELTLERILTAGSVINITDAGAGSTITVAIDIDGDITHFLRGDGTWASVTFATHPEILQDSAGAILTDGLNNILYVETV